MAVFLLIFFLLLAAYGYLIDYYRRGWNAIPEYEPAAAPFLKVSVVVAVRNEEAHIGNLLHCLVNQNYPEDQYEIIIVDDHSMDGTKEKLAPFLDKIRYDELGNEAAGKKTAIARGIEISMGELVITTDADCVMGADWIRVVSSFSSEKNAAFVAAPVLMQSPRSFIGIFQALDFLTLQGITGASVYKRFHTMCNGANLAYSRTAFNEVRGFEGIDTIPSGDDMLLMHKIYLKHPEQVFYLKNKNAVVTTVAEKTWKDFFNQRIRWASKASYYDDKKIRVALWLTYLVNCCFLVLGVASVIHFSWFAFLFLFLVAKIIIEFPLVNAVALFFGRPAMMKYFVLLQPVHIIYIIVAGWMGKFGAYHWKSRLIQHKKQ